jgi:hypothetical protein
MPVVERDMRRRERRREVFLLCLSPSHPKNIPPKGRMRKAPAKMEKDSRRVVVGEEEGGKKARPISSAK